MWTLVLVLTLLQGAISVTSFELKTKELCDVNGPILVRKFQEINGIKAEYECIRRY